ncbi:MAG: heme-binding protein [Halofilum sp. (in: g-proteobacteria)]|nr:heme-binding protein [Halofilum sp. (in: g-proteobacteria)]
MIKKTGLLLCSLALTLRAAPGPGAGPGCTRGNPEVLKPELAFKLARAALEACRERDYQVAVSVVDRFGNAQAMVRDRYAGPHTPETSRRKAWTAVSFRTNTTEMAEATKAGTPQAAARDIDDALMLGGGVLIEAGGSMVGAVGVSGAPSGAERRCLCRGGPPGDPGRPAAVGRNRAGPGARGSPGPAAPPAMAGPPTAARPRHAPAATPCGAPCEVEA